MMSSQEHEYYEILLMKLLDSEISSQEKGELEEHLKVCEDCREELSDFREIQDVTDQVRQRILQDAKIESFQDSGGRRLIWLFGFLLILFGGFLLFGFATWHFWMDQTVDLVVKIATLVIGSGLLVLFSYVLWIRVRGYKHDPYKEIDL